MYVELNLLKPYVYLKEDCSKRKVWCLAMPDHIPKGRSTEPANLHRRRAKGLLIWLHIMGHEGSLVYIRHHLCFSYDDFILQLCFQGG